MKPSEVPSQSGIYRITCAATGKAYIGQSTNMRARAAYHVRHLRAGKHTNKYLQSAWNKHGEDSFAFDVLEVCPKAFDVLNEREIYWINAFNALSKDCGYNLATGGSNGYSLGGMTECDRQSILRKIADKNRGRKTGKHSHNYGKHLPPEQRQLISRRNCEYYQHHTHPNLGRRMSDAQIERMRIANSGSRSVWFGKKRPEHSKLMTGGGNSRARPVICENTGQRFSCAKEAAAAYGTTNSNILKCCRGTQRYAGRAPDGAFLIWAYARERS